MIGFQRRLVVAVVSGVLVLGACGGSEQQECGDDHHDRATHHVVGCTDPGRDHDGVHDFFDGTNPDLNAKLKFLDDPAKYQNVYMKFANDPTTGPELKGASATVSKVVPNSDGTADVTYTVNLNGVPALKDQIGKAVLVNGQWKVAGATFCDLAALGSTSVDPACA